jgi:hypothetical protein
VRVGVVDEITPKQLANGRVIARLGLKLDTTVKPLPSDSTLLVRPRSALGLKYVEITKGTRNTGYADGATIALGPGHAGSRRVRRGPLDVRQKTRVAVTGQPRRVRRRAGRPRAGLNVAIENLNPLLVNLAARHAEPRRSADQALAPVPRPGRDGGRGRAVAETQAALFGNLDTTFAGLAKVTGPIQDSITAARPRSTPRSAGCRSSGRSCATPRPSSASCARACAP